MSHKSAYQFHKKGGSESTSSIVLVEKPHLVQGIHTHSSHYGTNEDSARSVHNQTFNVNISVNQVNVN